MGAGSTSYQAHGFHESLPRGKASGELTVSGSGLRFVSGDQTISMPLHGVQFRLGGASDRLVFVSHPDLPDLSVYTSDRSIMRVPLLSVIPSIQSQINRA
ncbi:MAG: hypothetical protein R3208_20500, partial [Ketobacteraceae bacterium]|nr:hypothetical protein [Ketobacteraceae bacterium]